MFGVPLHPLIVHFPIALAIVAFAYDARGVYSRQPRLHSVGSGLLKLAAATAILATGTGLDLAGASGLGSSSAVTGHAGVAIAATVILSALTLFRYSAETRETSSPERYSPAWLVLEGLAAVLVAAAAILGHRI